MPRARPLSKADIQARIEVFRPYSDAAIAAEVGGASYVLKQADADSLAAAGKIAAVAKKAGIPPDARDRFAERVELAWGCYLLECVVDRQEHPAAVIATLRPELVQAKRRLSRLQSLPPEPRFPFRAEEAGLGESIVAAEKELKSLRSQATANRLPSGAGLHLLQGLLATFAECGPQCPHSHWRAASPKQNGPRRRDTPRAKARCCKRCLNRWTDMALDELGVDHSDPKKNLRRFLGG